MSTKFEDWKYEDEVRFFLILEKPDEETGFYFKEYSKELELREIILGPRCAFTGEEIAGILGDLKSQAGVRQGLAFESFRVVRNKKASEKQA